MDTKMDTKSPLIENEHSINVSPMKGGLNESTNTDAHDNEEASKVGLTTSEAEKLLIQHGYNEIPLPVIPLWKIFLLQFTGTMPYMLEISCILSLVVNDVTDFVIIFVMLCCNAYLGFHEELKAKESLDELTSKMEQRVAVLRDGIADQMVTRFLVPGDVVLLVGGCAVPADCKWISGDVLSVDTAALTGEPLPRKYPSEVHGSTILSGCTIKAGEAYCCITETGVNTVAGAGSADIMADKAVQKVSIFEQRILQAVKFIILASIVDVVAVLLVQGFVLGQFKHDLNELILTCLSIIIASVPIALPLVLQVTMAMGAGKMATDYNAVVTSLPALQDIASMSCLCSDKTGTLTTADITIFAKRVWLNSKFTAADLALYGALSSNRDKKEDPIDRAVIKHFDTLPLDSPEVKAYNSEYTKVRLVGFNPIYKRVMAEYTHTDKNGKKTNIKIGKGLAVKCLDTEDGGKDDATDQWKVTDFDKLYPVVSNEDVELSKKGYKTLGVSVKIGDKPWEFVGILPMIDPPRLDTAATVENLQKAGIEVKMITGDHLNIAVETARRIGMGVNIRAGDEMRGGDEVTKELIRDADGFAQVLPRDKRNCVLTLKNHYNKVVGMTGDGVNDAPALSAAQCGIAVDDATDAAKNAAAIILTSPGLGAIYDGVIESRRIFRKLKAYVTYRFAATIQIVTVLTLLIFISNCPVNSLLIILLALFNDLTMLPIAYDNQQASRKPETPNVGSMLILCAMLGLLETIFSLAFVYGLCETMDVKMDLDEWDKTSQANVWLQISIAAELLIFSARAPSYMWTSIAPCVPLTVSVLAGCVITSIMAGCFAYFGNVSMHDIVAIWIYDILTLIVLDVCKVAFLNFIGDEQSVISEEEIAQSRSTAGIEDHARKTAHSRAMSGDGMESQLDVEVLMAAHENADRTKSKSSNRAKSRRLEAASARLSEWGATNGRQSEVMQSYRSIMDESTSTRLRTSSAADSSMASWRSNSMSSARLSQTGMSEAVPTAVAGAGISGRTHMINGSDLRPNFPPSRMHKDN